MSSASRRRHTRLQGDWSSDVCSSDLPFRTEYEIVSVGQINKLSDDTVTPEVLHTNRLIDIGKGNPVKVLADGEITRKVTEIGRASVQGKRGERGGGRVSRRMSSGGGA